MLLSPNGNDFYRPSYSFEISEVTQVGEARRFAQSLCMDLEMDETCQARVSIIVNELGNNLVSYGKNGRLTFRKCWQQNLLGIEILSMDTGAGLIEEVAMEDGFSSGTTPGTGLGAVKRQADEFDIYSELGKGTVVMGRVYVHRPSSSRTNLMTVGAVTHPIKGEVFCGDAWCLRETSQGFIVIFSDGLGHGILAQEAALKSVEMIYEFLPETLERLLKDMHENLRGTRGAAVFIAELVGDNLTFVGAGNIRTVLHGPDSQKTLISQNGTVGVRISTTRIMNQAWSDGSLLILHSDGIKSRWDLSLHPGLFRKHPSIIAGLIMRDYARDNDDAAVVVIRRQHD
mgnify:CR=1 FL=1